VLLPIKVVATSGRVGVHETDLPEGGWFPATPGSSKKITGILREIAASEF
jgi:hypothetical protein